MDEHLADVRRYDPTADEEAVTAIVAHLGVALSNARSLHVDPAEARQAKRVADKWCGGKLGCAQPERARLAVEMAALAMDADAAKRRVTFYYLAAKQLGRLDALTGAISGDVPEAPHESDDKRG